MIGKEGKNAHVSIRTCQVSIMVYGAAHLLLQDLCVCGALRSAQVERSMHWIRKFLQLVMPVALLGSLYGPLFLGGALMGSRSWLTPAVKSAVSGVFGEAFYTSRMKS